MATKTKHYDLLLPAQEDFYNVDDFNGNATKIDEKLFAQEQEIVGIGQKLDVVGQNVTANGEKITGVGQKVDAIGNKLGTPQDTGTDTIFGALANKKETIYVANKDMVQQELPTTWIEESRGTMVDGTVILGHFCAETDGEIYITASIGHNNHVSGSFTAKVFSGLVAEEFRKAPAATLYKRPEPTPLHVCTEYASYYGGAIMNVKKGVSYDFALTCSRLDDIRVSFKICYEMKTK